MDVYAEFAHHGAIIGLGEAHERLRHRVSEVPVHLRRARSVQSVRRRSYAHAMVLGIVVFGAAFLVGLGLGTYTRRPLSTAFLVVGSFTSLLLLAATGEVLGAAAVLAIVFLVGLVAESMRETLSLLVGRY